jgi:uncharacterized membrane protein YeaQ/YmgE (transglycosylase-associated protein family)
MDFIIWLIIGATMGWLFSLLFHAELSQSILLSIMVGIVGAFIAGWLVAPFVNIPGFNDYTYTRPFVMSVGGAVVLLLFMLLFKRWRIRSYTHQQKHKRSSSSAP